MLHLFYMCSWATCYRVPAKASWLCMYSERYICSTLIATNSYYFFTSENRNSTGFSKVLQFVIIIQPTVLTCFTFCLLLVNTTQSPTGCDNTPCQYTDIKQSKPG